MFKKISVKPAPGRDCKDFRFMYWRRGFCRLSNKCDFESQGYISKHEGNSIGCSVYCTGIKRSTKRMGAAEEQSIE